MKVIAYSKHAGTKTVTIALEPGESHAGMMQLALERAGETLSSIFGCSQAFFNDGFICDSSEADTATIHLHTN